MKIKRFEAACMSDALRLIKKEFGDEAVILSAKSVKKSGGLISSKQSKKVVVTAAIDTTSVPGKEPSLRNTGAPAAATAAGAHGNSYASSGKLQFLKRFNPITRTGQQKLQSKFVHLASDSRDEEMDEGLHQRLVSQGVKDAIAADFDKKATFLVTPNLNSPDEWRGALSQVILAKEIVAPAHQVDNTRPRIVVMVGPSGCGKTTMVAKLAAAQARRSPESVSFLSLDDQRIAGRAELERYASILGIPLETAVGPDEVGVLLNKATDRQLVVVDTPGLGTEDTPQRDHLKRMISAMPGAQVHLLLNADTQERSMARAVTFFKPVGVQRLGFTRLDWTDVAGGLINQAMAFELPITYLSSTPKVTQGVQRATAEFLAGLLLPSPHNAPFGLERTISATPNSASDGRYYVANRNSDIFHKNDCISVKRINNNNMVTFKDPAQALGQQFKPCRICSGELLISKPIQRVAYQYASNR